MQYRYASVLTIAGSDSGGGAGIQADIKTISALGCYAASAVTAITVQNTLGVSGIHDIPPDIVQAQIHAVMQDIAPAAIKIGMLRTAGTAAAVAEALQHYPQVPVVLDPVMVASSGNRLMNEETITLLRRSLFPLATLVTPNLDEAAVLTGNAVTKLEEMEAAAKIILGSGCQAVLIKGGHLAGEKLHDLLLQQNGVQVFTADYIDSRNTHGTGCTLSSAIAAYLAQGQTVADAVAHAKNYITTAIEAGKDVITGKGRGPLNHFVQPVPLKRFEALL